MSQGGSRVLVTGAGGFIGQHLCQQLEQKGYEVVALLRSQPISGPPVVADNSNHLGDINDIELLERALEGVEVVFHLAGIAHVEGSDTSVLQSVNTDGTACLIQAALAAKVRKIVFFSSSLASAAESKSSEFTPYGESKYQAELLLRQACENSALKVCILRPVNVYGAGMKGNLAAMIRRIRDGTLPPLPDTAAQFSLIAATDLCSAAILACEHELADGKTYIVTDGVDYNINEIEAAIYQALGKVKPRWRSPRMVLYVAATIAELLGKLTGHKSSLGRRTYRNLVGGSTFSNASICDELGFKPVTTFYNELPAIVASLNNVKGRS